MHEQVGAADELAVAHLQLDELAAVRAGRLDAPVRVQRGGDPERVPGAVREPRTAARLDAVRRLDGRERVQHPDLGRARPEDERVGVVQAQVGRRRLRHREPELRGHVRGRPGVSVADEGGVEVVPNTQVELVHQASINREGEKMNFGVRTILLLAAVVLFVIAVFADDPSNLWSLGLAAFAGAFLSDALGWADRTIGTTDRRDTT